MWSYILKVSRRSWKDGYPWGRDNVGVALIATLVPPIVIRLFHPSRLLDAPTFKATIGTFICILLTYAILSCFRASVSIDKEQTDVLKDIPVSPVTSADWQELSRMFKAAETGARAYWNCNDDSVTWRIDDNDECKALCVKAGAMLLRSPAVIRDISTRLPMTSSHLDRWLEFVKLIKGTSDQSHFSDVRPNGSSYFQHAANIRDISTVSAILCIERSAYEL